MAPQQEGPWAALSHRVDSWTLAPAWGVLVLSLWPGACQAALVVNEFLPDPAGSDGGREFVEILNTGPQAEAMAGLRLQFANGAVAADWLTRWTGDAGSVLGPGERFLIVDRNWAGDPAGQAEVYLGLQNGPDALRLVRDLEVLDMVGYGPLTDPAMMETNPAEIASGRSVSRRPDGRDTGDNSRDFVLADPTPGAANFHPFSLAVMGWSLDPPSLDRNSSRVRFTLQIINNGTRTFPAGALVLRVDGRDHPSLLDRLPADQDRIISWMIAPSGEGLLPLQVLVPLPEDPDTLVIEPAWLQVGPADVVLNEVLAVPRQGQGEWVEIRASGTRDVDLGGYRLKDEDGPWCPLPAVTLAAGSFLVLSQDSLALDRWRLDNLSHGAPPDCGTGVSDLLPRNLSGWPTLNNSPTGEREFADRVYLSDPLGNVIDHLTLGGREVLIGGPLQPDRSLERLAVRPRNPGASNWAPCTALAGSTPGCSNSAGDAGNVTTVLTVRPRILDRAAGVTALHFLFSLTGEQTGWELRIFDLWGGLVRDFGGEDLGPGPRDLVWDGQNDQGLPAGPGGYVALLETRDSRRQRVAREKSLLVIR